MATIKIQHPAIPAPSVILALGQYRPWSHHLQVYGRSAVYPEHSGKLLDLKDGKERGLAYCLRVLTENIKTNQKLAIAAIPSSDAAKIRSGVQQLVTRFAPAIGGVDLGNLILRTKSIPKLAGGGDRAMSVHLGSMAANQIERLEGRTVLLIDDILTTGNSLAAGRKILIDAGAIDVICVALGQTIHD